MIEVEVQVTALIIDKIFTTILVEYSYYSNIFLAKNVAKLLEQIKINEYAIELEKGKWPYFGLIYSLESVKLEILKIYIKTNSANSFI